MLEAVHPPEEATRLRERVGDKWSVRDRLASKDPIGITGRCAVEGNVIIVNDITTHPDYVPFVDGTASEIVVPLYDHGHVIGVLNVESGRRDAFNNADVDWLRAVGALAVIALNNAREHEHVEQMIRVARSRTVLAWLGLAANHGFHTIHTAASSIVFNAVGLRNELASHFVEAGVPTSVDEILADIRSAAEKIQEKEILPPLSPEHDISDIYITEFVGARLDQLWLRPPHNSIPLTRGLEAGQDMTFRGSPQWIRRAFDILINNAVSELSNLPADRQRLVVRTYQDLHQAVIEVRDTGRGIPEHIRSQIFTWIVDQPRPDLESGGLGIGLLIAQAIVDTYGGTLSYDTGPNGAAMYMKFATQPINN